MAYAQVFELTDVRANKIAVLQNEIITLIDKGMEYDEMGYSAQATNMFEMAQYFEDRLEELKNLPTVVFTKDGCHGR